MPEVFKNIIRLTSIFFVPSFVSFILCLYFRGLADCLRAREALKSCLPEPLRNASFAQVLKDDTSTKRCLAQLLYNLSDQNQLSQEGMQ